MCLLRRHDLVATILHKTIHTLTAPAHIDLHAYCMRADQMWQSSTSQHTKLSKHRPLKLIRKRVNTTLGAFLRTVLMSFVNKTDIEAPRALQYLAYVYLPTFYCLSRLTRRFQGRSYAEFAQCDAVQLARLHSFNPQNVVSLERMFELPFRMGTAGDALSTVAAFCICT